MTVIQEKLVDKVRKLINKAESTDSQAEADAFMLKANQILLEHNLSMSQIETEDDAGEIAQDKQAVIFGEIKSEGNQWETLLMSVLCNANMCRSIIHAKRRIAGGTISIIGNRGNIETVIYLFDIAKEIIRKLSKSAYKDIREETINAWLGEMTEKELLKSGQLPNRMPWIRNYLKGAVLGLNEKLQSQKKEMTRDMGEAIVEQFGLMVISNEKAIDIFIKDEYSNLGKGRATTIADRSAYARGKADGKNINLNRGISGSQGAVPKQLS